MFLSTGNQWCLCKGKPKSYDSSEQETAKRRLQQETGLQVDRFLTSKTYIEEYEIEKRGGTIPKQVKYFLAEVVGNVKLLASEVAGYRWVEITTKEETIRRLALTHAEDNEVIKEVLDDLGIV